MQDEILRGTRVTLARARRDLMTELTALNERNQEFHAPWVYHADAYTYFERIAAGRTIGFFLGLPSEQALIGVINLNEPVMGALRSAYLGYYLDEAHTGRGYMTEGLSLAIGHAFRVLGFHRLEANIQPTNYPSIALVKRLGFRQEGFSPSYLLINGTWCDHERWAILAEDWSYWPATTG
jgi:ribosomal-protein-alanine N-acetyltransferase